MSAAVALVIGVPLMRLRGHYLAFATLAFALIAWSLLYAQDRFTGGNSDSQRSENLLRAKFPAFAGDSADVVVRTESPIT